MMTQTHTQPISSHILPPVEHSDGGQSSPNYEWTRSLRVISNYLIVSPVGTHPLPTSVIVHPPQKKKKINPPPCLHNSKRAQGQSNMPVNHTARCSAQIEFYRVWWLVYWVGYDVRGASVMDYEALFQESIQQETLQEKHLGASFKPARTPPAWRRKAHPPVTGCSRIQRNVI